MNFSKILSCFSFLLVLSSGSFLFGMEEIEEGGPTRWILYQIAAQRKFLTDKDFDSSKLSFRHDAYGMNMTMSIDIKKDFAMLVIRMGIGLKKKSFLPFEKLEDKYTICKLEHNKLYDRYYSCQTNGLTVEQFKKAVFAHS